jgi:ferritin-like metal-binding protein YciE
MHMETTRERLVRYLNDAWATEKALVDDLRDMAEKSDHPEVKALFAEHSVVTHAQEEMLEARIRALGVEPSGGKGFLSQVAAKMGEAFHRAHDDMDQTQQNLMKAFATENFECAMYASLAAYATEIGDAETATLCQEIMQQEKQAAEKVWQQIGPCAVRPARITGEGASLRAA